MMSHAKCSGLTAFGILLVLASVSPAPPDRSYVSGNFMMTLDGKNAGFVKSVDGGAITAEVINEPAGAGSFTKKHIGQPRYEPFAVQVGFSMTKPLYEWIAKSWAMKYERKSGSFIAADFNMQAQSERQFLNAIITETTIPAMDGSSKEPACITIKLAPEMIRVQNAAGKVEGNSGKNEQKVFLPASFKLQIDGLDCTKINKIDSFTVKQAAVTDNIGDARDYSREPGKIVFPNIKVTMAEATAQSWQAWHEDFVVKGNNSENAEKNGVLTLLSPNQQTVLARIKFFNMGIFSFGPEKSEANADQVKRVTAELYVERMEFEAGGEGGEPASTGTTTPPAATKPALRRG